MCTFIFALTESAPIRQNERCVLFHTIKVLQYTTNARVKIKIKAITEERQIGEELSYMIWSRPVTDLGLSLR